MSTLSDVFSLLDRLNTNGIYFTLGYHRPGYLMVTAVVPGERWEIELQADGEPEIEVFVSRGGVEYGATVEELFERFGEPSQSEPNIEGS